MSEAPELSIVITCYFEEDSIDEFYTRLSAAAESLGRSYELILVNDGSTDSTYSKHLGFFEEDPNLTTVIDLFRNAGQTAAMTAGLTHARGKAIVFMDSDLQLDPEQLPMLVDKFDEGYDIVSGTRANRRDSLLRRVSSRLANFVMRRVARHEISDFGCTFKIYDAALIRAFEFGPFKPWRTAYVFARAQRCVEVEVAHHERRYGSSGWTLRSLFSFFMDHLVGLSERPFQALSLGSFAVAVVIAVRILTSWAVPIQILSDVTPGMILNAILLNLLIVIAVLSVIGEYVLRNFLALQRYPAYIIRDIRQKTSHQEPDAQIRPKPESA